MGRNAKFLFVEQQFSISPEDFMNSYCLPTASQKGIAIETAIRMAVDKMLIDRQ